MLKTHLSEYAAAVTFTEAIRRDGTETPYGQDLDLKGHLGSIFHGVELTTLHEMVPIMVRLLEALPSETEEEKLQRGRISFHAGAITTDLFKAAGRRQETFKNDLP